MKLALQTNNKIPNNCRVLARSMTWEQIYIFQSYDILVFSTRYGHNNVPQPHQMLLLFFLVVGQALCRSTYTQRPIQQGL